MSAGMFFSTSKTASSIAWANALTLAPPWLLTTMPSVMGSVLASAADNIERPKVGLLNVGEEEIKGNELVKKANEIFEQSAAINYIGYVEGNAIFDGVADVIVCDGFVGNAVMMAGRSMPGSVFKTNRAVAINAPVLPEEE